MTYTSKRDKEAKEFLNESRYLPFYYCSAAVQETTLLAIAGQKLLQTVWGQKGADLLGLE